MSDLKRRFVAALLFCLPHIAFAHGDRFEDYSCFNLKDFKVHYCVPYDASLITMEVTEGTVWVAYETENLPVTYGVSIEHVEDFEVPQDIEAGYALTRFGSGDASVNPPPRARAITLFNDMAIVEVEAGDDTLNAFFVEVFSPNLVARFDVIDASPEFPDETIGWEKIRSGMRYLVDIEGYSLGQISKIEAMEVAPWP